MAGKTLRLGCVPYLNARPLISGWSGPLVYDHPANLCRQLAAAQIDMALVSSVEFLRNPVYQIVHGIAIASRGPVLSVFVACRGAIADLQSIELDPASMTSNALVQCILAEADLSHVRTVPLSGDESIPEGRGRLFIGDRALRFRARHGSDYRYWDLGQEWTQRTGLPFVYALWLAQPALDAAEVAQQLRHLRDQNLGRLSELAAAESSFPADFTEEYWRNNVVFSLDDDEMAGFRLFEQRLESLGFLPRQKREFRFV